MRKNRWALGLLSGALMSGGMLMAGTTASATTLEKLKFDDMVMKSSACVVAEAVSIEYGRDANGIYTLTTFSVSNAAFGEVGNTFTVRSDGGRINNGKISAVSVTAAAPQFYVGKEHMLFLQDGDNGNYQVTGFSQGIFNVRDGNMIALPESMGGAAAINSVMDRARTRRSGGAISETIDE